MTLPQKTDIWNHGFSKAGLVPPRGFCYRSYRAGVSVKPQGSHMGRRGIFKWEVVRSLEVCP
jgi:hypothetical protein